MGALCARMIPSSIPTIICETAIASTITSTNTTIVLMLITVALAIAGTTTIRVGIPFHAYSRSCL